MIYDPARGSRVYRHTGPTSDRPRADRVNLIRYPQPNVLGLTPGARTVKGDEGYHVTTV